MRNRGLSVPEIAAELVRERHAQDTNEAAPAIVAACVEVLEVVITEFPVPLSMLGDGSFDNRQKRPPCSESKRRDR